MGGKNKNKQPATGETVEVKGLVTVKFLKKFGSYKVDEEAKYHISTVRSLIKNGTCEIVK